MMLDQGKKKTALKSPFWKSSKVKLFITFFALQRCMYSGRGGFFSLRRMRVGPGKLLMWHHYLEYPGLHAFIHKHAYMGALEYFERRTSLFATGGEEIIRDRTESVREAVVQELESIGVDCMFVQPMSRRDPSYIQELGWPTDESDQTQGFPEGQWSYKYYNIR